MAWLHEGDARPPRSYRTIRWLSRGICDTWFREHAIVDHEWIPEEGGVLFAAWHPGSMIDPLFMFSSIPGQLTFAAKHTLFNYPILGRVMRSVGAKPIYRASDKGEKGAQAERGAANEGLLDTLAGILVEQGRCAIYPEGTAHLGQPSIVNRLVRILFHWIVAYDMVGAGEDNPLNPGQSRGLVDVACSDNVILQNRIPAPRCTMTS